MRSVKEECLLKMIFFGVEPWFAVALMLLGSTLGCGDSS
jgi:hypothetical protein